MTRQRWLTGARGAAALAWVTLALCVPADARAAAAPGESALRAGAATANITPPIGLDIIGGFNPYPSTHVHDELHARCLVLDNGRRRVAMVVCDLIGVSRELADAARALIHAECQIPPECVLITATHTHSASSALAPNRYAHPSPPLTEYQRFVLRRLGDVARCAVNRLAPARVGWAVAKEPRHVFNRRWFLKPGAMPENPFGSKDDQVKMNPTRASADLVRPAGPTDPEITVLSVRSPDGRPLALFASYSLHYVGGVPSGHLSADYYGEFCRIVARRLGAHDLDPPFVPMLGNGTSGDINNIDFTRPAQKQEPYEKIRQVAGDVADAVLRACEKIEHRDAIALDGRIADLEVTMRHPTPDQLARARAILDAAPRDPARKTRPLPEIYAQRTLDVSAGPRTLPVPLQALRVGDVAITGIPNEVFVEIGLELKRRSPLRPAVLLGLTNGYYGYLPTPEQHRLGGYETWLGTNRFAPDTSTRMLDTLLDLIGKMQGP